MCSAICCEWEIMAAWNSCELAHRTRCSAEGIAKRSSMVICCVAPYGSEQLRRSLHQRRCKSICVHPVLSPGELARAGFG